MVPALSSDQIGDVATSAFIYAYPLIMMEITRRVSTNVADTRHFNKAPMNQFGNVPAFPDATFTDVVRPNADTLYPLVWFDVSKEPLLISVPNSGGRYYLLVMLDMWTGVFDSREAHDRNKRAASCPRRAWMAGPHPAEAMLIHSPTAMGWIIGRTQTNGKADYDAAHKFQAGLIATPLSQWGKSYRAPPGKINPDWDMKTPPTEQAEKLIPAGYFSLFAELTRLNPPHAYDYPILHQMRRIGIEPGKPFAFDKASPDIQRALADAGPAALKKIKAQFSKAGIASAGWRTNLTAVGTYGADYLSRAAVAYAGLGANTIEDAVYPTAFADLTASRSTATIVMYCISIRIRYRRYTASGRSRCITTSKPSRPIPLTATPLATVISSHSVLTVRLTFTSSVTHPARTKKRTGYRLQRAVPSR